MRFRCVGTGNVYSLEQATNAALRDELDVLRRQALARYALVTTYTT